MPYERHESHRTCCRVRPNAAPTSSSVWMSPPPIPKRRRTTSCSRALVFLSVCSNRSLPMSVARTLTGLVVSRVNHYDLRDL